MSQPVVRPARPEELEAAGVVTRAAYAAAGLGSEAYLAHVADAAARSAASLLLVAERAGQIVGTVTLAAAGEPYADIARAGEYEFRMLAVLPSASGSGIGTALVHECDRVARCRGADRLVCSVEAANTAGLRLYQRLGFVREPSRDWSPEAGVWLLVFGSQLSEQEQLSGSRGVVYTGYPRSQENNDCAEGRAVE